MEQKKSFDLYFSKGTGMIVNEADNDYRYQDMIGFREKRAVQ